MQPGPHRTHSEPLPLHDASGESTPLLLGSPLPPPAYPSLAALDKNAGAGASDMRYTDDDGGPSRDLEEAGVEHAAVHLHRRPNRPWSRGIMVRLLLILCAHAILIWLILAAWGRSSRKHHDLPNSASPHLPSYCQQLHSQKSTHDFEDPAHVQIVEQLQQQREGHHDIQGSITLVPADANQPPCVVGSRTGSVEFLVGN